MNLKYYKNMKNLFYFVILVFYFCLGNTQSSLSDETSHWYLLKVLENNNENKNKYETLKKAFVKISVPGKSYSYYALGWVNILFDGCWDPNTKIGYMTASGELTVIKQGKDIGAKIKVKSLPLKADIYNKKYEINQNVINKKIKFEAPYENPIFWLDIDGDTEKELISSSVCGNRFSTHSFIYEYDESSNNPKLFNPIEIRDLDMTDAPLSKIETYGSGGVCNGSEETYVSINNKYQLTKYMNLDSCNTKIFELEYDGNWCLKESYEGKFENLKTFSREECYSRSQMTKKFGENGYFQKRKF